MIKGHALTTPGGAASTGAAGLIENGDPMSMLMQMPRSDATGQTAADHTD